MARRCQHLLLIILVVFLCHSALNLSSSRGISDVVAQSEMPSSEKNSITSLAPQAASAILLEAETGKILFEKNKDMKLPPASITKVMTMLLVMEAIERQDIRWNDIVTASEYAASMGGAQLYLEPGDTYTVDEMLKAIALESANDASLAIAEYLAGSEPAFIDLMNKRAIQLGMKHSKFANPHGLPVEDEMNHHYSSAADIAIMSRELLKHEKILEYTGLERFRLMQNNGKPFDMTNSNAMLGSYEGMDGLKTGFTYTAKQCLVATAKRNGMRLIAVVLGEPDKPTRATEISAMLDYGFANYAIHTFVKDGQELGVVKIYKGTQGSIRYRAQSSYSVVMKKTDNVQQYSHKVTLESSLKAPVSVGDQVGKVVIYKDGKVLETHRLHVNVSFEKMSFLELLEDVFRRVLFATP